MKFYSINRKSAAVSLHEAVLRGLAPDGGLYMPEKILPLAKSFLRQLGSLSFQEISLHVARHLFGEDVPANILKKIIADAYPFDAPLVRLDEGLFTLELFHGPTLSFKDFAARFMARLMAYFIQDSQQELTVLVATSGDTGSAVAQGFLGVAGIRVVIVYPSGMVSEIQEKQLTTMGKNVTALNVQGSFDDCQRMVKQAFLDGEIQKKLMLASANSINIARLFPQTFYHVSCYAQLPDKTKPVVVSVPSGNFGNLTAGLLAKRMGLPIAMFVASTNENNVVPEYLRTGHFVPRPSRQTMSSAMDIGHPSNFIRMLELYGGDREAMKKDVYGASFSDEQTAAAMHEVFEKYGYVMDPHGAVGYLGLEQYLRSFGRPANGIFIETAHPAKFVESVEQAIGQKVELPQALAACLKKEKKSVALPASFEALKEFLLARS